MACAAPVYKIIDSLLYETIGANRMDKLQIVLDTVAPVRGVRLLNNKEHSMLDLMLLEEIASGVCSIVRTEVSTDIDDREVDRIINSLESSWYMMGFERNVLEYFLVAELLEAALQHTVRAVTTSTGLSVWVSRRQLKLPVDTLTMATVGMRYFFVEPVEARMCYAGL